MDGVRSYCAVGAIELAAEDLNDRNVACLHLNDSIEHHTGRNWYGVVPWNDHPGRTHAEVLEAFDRAIEDA